MNICKYIFAQVIDFIPRYQFDKLAKKYKGDWHAKDLTCYYQLLHLLFGQITGCYSIRDICLRLEAHGRSIYHLGIRSLLTNPTCAVLMRKGTTRQRRARNVSYRHRPTNVLKYKGGRDNDR